MHAFEAGDGADARTVHFPKSCLHCEDAPCVTVCPTGASFKRAEDGIVLVNEDWCIGCGLCAWSCPYGARELDPAEGVMKKCTLCVDRIYNDNIPEEDRVPACVRTCPTNARHFGDLGDPTSDVSKMVLDRGGVDLMPEQETRPVNKYLPPRPRRAVEDTPMSLVAMAEAETPTGFWKWIDSTLTSCRPERKRRGRNDAACMVYYLSLPFLGWSLDGLFGTAAAHHSAEPSGVGAGTLALIGVGLISSTFHLGHPERAWRALASGGPAGCRRRRAGGCVMAGLAGWFAAAFYGTAVPSRMSYCWCDLCHCL